MIALARLRAVLAATWPWVRAAALAGMLVALAVMAARPDVHRAGAIVEVASGGSERATLERKARLVTLILSADVAERTARRLGDVDADDVARRVTARTGTGARVIRLEAEGATPTAARDLVGAFADASLAAAAAVQPLPDGGPPLRAVSGPGAEAATVRPRLVPGALAGAAGGALLALSLAVAADARRRRSPPPAP